MGDFDRSPSDRRSMKADSSYCLQLPSHPSPLLSSFDSGHCCPGHVISRMVSVQKSFGGLQNKDTVLAAGCLEQQ